MKVLLETVVLLTLALSAAARSPCPEVDSAVDVVLPNPEDCTTYYQCSNGEPLLLPCPHDLHWNDAAKLCDHPAQAGCDRDVRRSSSSSFVPPGVVKRCMRSPVGTRLADPEDCAGFYICLPKLPAHQQCMNGLLYNDYLQVCDWPENVDCCENGGETPEATAEPSVGPPSTLDPEGPLPDCKSGEEFIPNIEDCSTYYQCVDGAPKFNICPDGLNWNQKLSICDYPENTICEVK